MIGLLRQRNFALLWFGGLISVAGDWVLYAALPFFVFERTHSTIATSGMIAAELAPSIVIGSLAGVYVDRLDRRRLLVVTNVLQAAVVSALLAVAGGGPLWVVYAVAALQSVLSSFSQPAESALLPSLVAPEVLLAANSLTALNNRLARLVGVPLGGLLLGLLGLGPVVLADAASFLAAAAMIAAVVAPPRVRTLELASFSTEWRDGLRTIRRDRAIAVLFGVLGLMTFGGTMLDPLYVAWVRDVLGRGPQIYALLLTAHSVAGIAGSFAVGIWGGRFTPRFLVGWTSIVAGAALIVKFDVPLIELAFGLSLLGGATSVVSSVAIDTLVQRTVPDGLRGRVFAALGASGSFFSLAGAVVGGVVARWVGVTPMLNVASGLVIVAGVVVLRAFNGRRARDDEAVADPDLEAVTDGVVTLRQPRPGDAQLLIEGRDAEFFRWLGPGSESPSPVACIWLGDELVGWVDYDVEQDWLQPGEVNVGYYLFPDARGKGYASRAVELLLLHLARQTDHAVATLLIDPENVRSVRLARRLGFIERPDHERGLYFARDVRAVV